MYRFDTGVTLADLYELKRKLQQVQDRRLSLVQATAQYGVNLVRDRIQLTGRDSNDQMLLTSSAKRIGRYSESHGSVRQKEGLRTDIVNLTFSGELLNSNSWAVIEEDPETFGAGFREDKMSDLAQNLEEIFDTDIFQMSLSEEDETADYFNDGINDLVTATF